MKSILIVAATQPEVAWLKTQFSIEGLERIRLDFLVTGVGMINTAFHLGSYLANNQPDFAIQLGIAGSFSVEFPIGSVVEVANESLPELGAESPGGFLGMEELGFPLLETKEGKFYNCIPNNHRYLEHLPWVQAVTVNRVSGITETIEQLKSDWNPSIETMEGAAFFLAMKQVGIPFFELRAISNRVEPRDRSSWKIKEAIQASQEEVWAWLKNNLPKMEE